MIMRETRNNALDASCRTTKRTLKLLETRLLKDSSKNLRRKRAVMGLMRLINNLKFARKN
jgi:hypothetical protein